MTQDEPEIIVDFLHKSFAHHHVLKGINLQINKGSSLVILGGSGSGKSVLIKSIVGLITPDAGSIKIKNEETINISDNKRFKILEKCGFLFQGGALFDSLSILENVVFFASKLKKLSNEEKVELATLKLEKVGLNNRLLNQFPSELSGGMQKRVALARAICSDPEIIFFDEPTTGLDPIMANVIDELIIKARDELGATTITITHDIKSAEAVATDIAFLYKGEIIWKGPRKEMRSSDNEYLNQFINGLTKGPIEI